MKVLTAVPVYNEAAHVDTVLDAIVAYSDHVLVVDDGSTDDTPTLLAKRRDVTTIRHEPNRGYGAALRTAFDHASANGFDVVVTVDCDGQHQPQRIPMFVAALSETDSTTLGGRYSEWDVVSGSRYLDEFEVDSAAPADRRAINLTITQQLRDEFELQLTDAFCGFKAYRVPAIARLELTEDGYAMPLEFWVQAAASGLRIRELPVPRIYLDEERSFGGDLDESSKRLRYYRDVIERSRMNAERSTERSRDSLAGKAGEIDCEGWIWATRTSA